MTKKFSGYYDKNNRKIYDGDVLFESEDKDGYGIIGIVGEKNGIFGDVADGFYPLDKLMEEGSVEVVMGKLKNEYLKVLED